MEFIKTEKVKAANAMGQDTVTFWHSFKIEESDKGKMIPNIGGHGQPGRRLSAGDVGKTLIKYTESADRHHVGGWHCYTIG